MTKKELRVKYKAMRASLAQSEIEAMSLKIANKLLSLPIWEHWFYHIFMPIPMQREVDTEFVLHILSGKDKNTVIPKSHADSREMTHFLLTDDTKLAPNQWNIPEPVNGAEVDVSKIDVVFVPLLAFDKAGHRVGYGKGFYDKFLATCRPETVKIGLSFFEAEENCGEIFESDVKLDYCVTPETVYVF
jgi:5-formyltetrahydrofolate cyclo-ligase